MKCTKCMCVIIFIAVVSFSLTMNLHLLEADQNWTESSLPKTGDWGGSLHHASYVNNVQKMRQLIEEGADVDEVFGNYARPLHYAVCKGHVEATELLLASNADINGRDDQGNTVLMHAVRAGQRDMVAFLIQKGADVILTNKNGETPLISVSGINRKTAEWMAEQDGVSDKEPDLIAIAEMLLKKNVYINARTEREHNTALINASFEGYAELVKILLKAGSDVNVATKLDTLTPLMQAARENHLIIVESLLAAGADPNTRDRMGRTAFDWSRSYPEVVRALKGAGGRSGETKTGTAPMQEETKELKPAAQVPEIVIKLKSMGCKYTEDSFFHAVLDGKVKAVELYLQAGISPNVQRTSRSGSHTPLNLAVLGCAQDSSDTILKMVKILIEYGADVNIADMNGSPPLTWAVQIGCHFNVIKTLIEAGADVNARAAGGATPLMMATVFQKKEIIQLLKKAGAKE